MWRFFWYNFEWWSERGRFDGGSSSDDDDDDAYLRACVYEYEYEYDLHLDGSSSHSVSISILPEEKKKTKNRTRIVYILIGESRLLAVICVQCLYEPATARCWAMSVCSPFYGWFSNLPFIAKVCCCRCCCCGSRHAKKNIKKNI